MEIIVDPSDPGARGCEPVPIHLVGHGYTSAILEAGPSAARAAATLAGFKGAVGELVLVPSSEGALERVLFGLGDTPAAASFRGLSARLPPGDYRIDSSAVGLAPDDLALAWEFGTYRFDRYKARPAGAVARLVAPHDADVVRVRILAAACALTRDLVNTPANDMGPDDIGSAAHDLAAGYGASLSVVVGDDLIEAGYPAVHAVGRAATAARAPRMIEMTWGEADRPLVVVIGKGVAFDTGGLDIKPSAGMRHMKKDMGGAAHALGLARMIMGLALPVRLAVLIPAVENAISADAMRPGDVLSSRSGLSIEVGNTDAEGRLILADALTRAGELNPDLTLDLATLTGAARVALGPQVIPFYTDDDDLAAALAAGSIAAGDPIWRMPLWAPYAAALDSDVADIKNDPDGWAQAGSVTAALFLQRFAPKGPWAHFDIFAWNPRARPGWPVGAEAQAILAIFAMLEARYR